MLFWPWVGQTISVRSAIIVIGTREVWAKGKDGQGIGLDYVFRLWTLIGGQNCHKLPCKGDLTIIWRLDMILMLNLDGKTPY